mmetsp:Transcript_65034/g.188572  ORF Transcript_65034/g.188572 Transcript_65034/m.188572 type:complete len:1100 (-) Transcript_65034:45-3344(-)
MLFSPQERSKDALPPIRLGICAMEKKATSKPMQTILKLLTRHGDIEAVTFPETVILEAPVEEWPHPVDVLICFFSEGFPLDKAEAYVELRKPALVNDVTAQRILLDRRRVYALLEENGIPHPQAILVERDPETGEVLSNEKFEEGDDFLQIGDTKINKPFVEKPIDAEDHNICIYYPSSAGGGVKRLFRKVGDRSSSFDPDVKTVRTDGSYMYEPFMKTQGTDIKVYTVGPEYAHAEARKSPVIDGVVNRNEDGKEVRFPVVLTPKEKEMARRVCMAFTQFVCGFDLLRTTQGSYVIDVNGWSFVKGIPKYYEDAAAILRAQTLRVSGRISHMRRVESLVAETALAASVEKMLAAEVDCKEPLKDMKSTAARSDRWEHEELLAVLAVMRHGDRTPKNKMKLTTSRKEFLDLHKRWASGPRKEVKLKAPRQLQEVLDLTYALLGPSEEEDPIVSSRPQTPKCSAEKAEFREASDFKSCQEEKGGDPEPVPLDDHAIEACKLIRAVLSEGHFDGIYRKVQVKPSAWVMDSQGVEEVAEVTIVLKYGGILTPVGVKQAEELGHIFRGEMYPGETDAETSGPYASGLLRLHATQRHDFKVYSSDEGRVQMSAAAFARGLLDLEADSLTPICVALVETDSIMLDDLPSAAVPLIEAAKQQLYETIRRNHSKNDVCLSPTLPTSNDSASSVTGASSVAGSASGFKRKASTEDNTPGTPPRLQGTTSQKGFEEQLNALVDSMDFGKEVDEETEPINVDTIKTLQEHIANLNKELENIDASACSTITKPLLIQKRWRKLQEELWDKKANTWNVSKLPEIRDAVRFDLIHHPKIGKSLWPVWEAAKCVNDVIVPREYGVDLKSRVKIGAVVCQRLLKKLLIDLSNSVNVEKQAEELPSWKLTTAVQFLKRIVGVMKGAPKEAARTILQPEADECLEAEFAGLDTRHAGEMKSPHRRVRTRLYFTSESHIQTLMNVLRYCHLVPMKTKSGETASRSGRSDDGEDGTHCNCEGARIVCPEVERKLTERPIFDYLTQIVFRLYEDKRAPQNGPERFRVEVLFSPGATSDPTSEGPPPLEKLEPLHTAGRPLTYACLQELLGPFASSRQQSS